MNDDRLATRLETYFDVRLRGLEPPPDLRLRILEVPLQAPVPTRRPFLALRRAAAVVLVLLSLSLLIAAIGAITFGWFRQPQPGPAAVALTTFGDIGMHAVGLDGERDADALNDCEACGPLVVDIAWSADGMRLAYATGCAGLCASSDTASAGIWVRDANTGRSSLLLVARAGDASDGVPLTAGVSALDWSPNGSQILFAARGGGLRLVDVRTREVSTLAVMNPAGTSAIRPLLVDGLSWSPDGRMIAFSTRGGAMFVTRTDGSGTLAIGDGSQPDWSPDGGLIAYRLGCELWTTSPDGVNRVAVARFAEGTWGHGTETGCDPYVPVIRALGPAWSPDGSRLAAIFANRLYVLDADGTDIEILQDPIPRGMGGVGLGVDWQPETSP